jgi:hypothetical protein
MGMYLTQRTKARKLDLLKNTYLRNGMNAQVKEVYVQSPGKMIRCQFFASAEAWK